jgi:hypothetical protein
MKKTAILLSLLALSCGKSKDNDNKTVVETAPNVCKSLAVMGTFPVNAQPNVQTYGIACFEGYQIQEDGRKWYAASLKCSEAKKLVELGDEMSKKNYEPLETASCPLEDVIATCDMGTAKTLVYKGSEEFFKKDAFNAYCTENKGIALYK